MRSPDNSQTFSGTMERTGKFVCIEYTDNDAMCLIRIDNEGARIKRSSETEYEITLKENQPSSAVISTPYGDINAFVTTNSVSAKHKENSVMIELDYSMSLDGAVSDIKIKLLATEI